jgi:hypothetical protein
LIHDSFSKSDDPKESLKVRKFREMHMYEKSNQLEAGFYNIVMQEVFSKTDDPKVPLMDQKFCLLRLFGEPHKLGTRFCVELSYGEWSDIDGDFMFKNDEVAYFWILDVAKRRYAERRRDLDKKDSSIRTWTCSE